MKEIKSLLENKIWREAWEVQAEALRDFHKRAVKVLGSGVPLKPLPSEAFDLERNLFSVLFLILMRKLGLRGEKLALYAVVTHCLRALVTGCDNILDGEYKEVLPFPEKDGGGNMKSVFLLMAAQGILSDLAMETLDTGLLNREQAGSLIPSVMHVLAESGMEELEEEALTEDGEYPDPDDMIDNYLYRKTGRLFESPVRILVLMGEIDPSEAKEIISTLSGFGMGCQLLDEINDYGEDLDAGGYNMVSALVYHDDPSMGRRRMKHHLEGHDDPDLDKALFRARRQCFLMALKRFLSVRKALLKLIPELGRGNLMLMGSYVMRFILGGVNPLKKNDS